MEIEKAWGENSPHFERR
jgi:hypothetical protein